MSTLRLLPLEPPYSDAAREVFARVMPAGVEPLVLFRALAINERVLLRVMAGGLLDRGSISLREREIVIDRTCARLGSEYEWGVHVAFFADKAKLSPKQIAATQEGGDPGAFPAREQLLLRLVDALVDTAQVPDALWSELSAEWEPAQLVELVVLVGLYHMISFTTNALRLPLEPFAARFGAPDKS